MGQGYYSRRYLLAFVCFLDIMIANLLPLWVVGLRKNKIEPDDITLLVSTHGHSDHTGNNNLFLKAKHVVGFNVSFEHRYFDHSFLYGTYYCTFIFEVQPMPCFHDCDLTQMKN